MVQIVSQPYSKTYIFPYSSFTFLTRILLLIVTVVAPFFIVYKTGRKILIEMSDFYQTSKTSYMNLAEVKLKPTYEYYISMKTTQQSYIFTNMFTSTAYQALTIKPMESLRVDIEYPKYLSEKVKEIDVFVPFQYSNYNKTSYGMIKANIKGYDLAQTSTVGFIEFKDGTGTFPILKSDNILKSNSYNFLSVYEQFYKSSSYLSYRYNSVPVSLPSDLFQLNMLIHYPSVKVEEKTPSILGQLIWSWIQYFPIFFVFYLLTDYIWVFMLKQKLVKNTLKHDKDYLEIVRKQQDRRRGTNSHRFH